MTNISFKISSFSPWVGIRNISDYSPFGVLLPERTVEGVAYRNGFQGQERDDEVKGEGCHYSAQYWEYDPRMAKRWNLDPVIKHHESPFACFANNPILFSDSNGADTSNYTNAISAAGFNQAVTFVSASSTYLSFFQSFVDGSNKSITLEFQAVNNLTNYEDGTVSLDGQALLFYDGKHVGDQNFVLPEVIDISKFSIVIQLNSNIKQADGKAYQTEELNAIKGITISHEMLVHAISNVSMINDLMAGKISKIDFVKQYQSDDDHENLYNGNCKIYTIASNEIIEKLQSIPTFFYAQYSTKEGYDIDRIFLKLDSQQKHYFENGILYQRLNRNQLWKYKFRENMTRPIQMKK